MNKKGFTTLEIIILLALLAGLGWGMAVQDDAPVIIQAPPAQTEPVK